MIIRHRFYELSMDGLILLNTFLMLLRLSPYAITKSTSITVGHWMIVLLFLFLFEIIIKCYALSPSMYWNISIFNKIDVFSVGGSIGFIVLKWIGIFQEDEQSAWSDIFLLVRNIRMLRILRMNQAFRVISATVVEIAPALMRYMAVLAALFYAFALIGMEFFAGVLSRECLPLDYETMYECEERTYRLEHSSYGANNYWSNNFNTLPRALITLFEQMVVNNWVIVMEGTVAGFNSDWPRIYFIIFWVCCVVITMNVLVAFLIDAYQAHVASIALRVKKWERETRRRLHSQSSMPEDLKRSTSISSGKRRASTVDENYRAVERKLSEEETKWQRRLRAAACRLGYDISMYSVRREKGVGDFYQDLFKEN